MVNLTRAHQELFRRTPDECFDSLDQLLAHYQRQNEASVERWQARSAVAAMLLGRRVDHDRALIAKQTAGIVFRSTC